MIYTRSTNRSKANSKRKASDLHFYFCNSQIDQALTYDSFNINKSKMMTK